MVTFLTNKKRKERTPEPHRTTAISFSADERADLGHVRATGQALLRKSTPAITHLTAAMTRLGVTPINGL